MPNEKDLHHSALVIALLLGLFTLAPLAFAVDCNGDGREDAGDIESGLSEDCNDNGIPDGCEGMPVRFGVDPEPFPTPDTPRVLRAGDLDGDGDLDLVVGSRGGRGASGISILFNRGDGAFGTAVEYDLEENPYSIANADFDNDGDLDFVTANTHVILVWLNRGDGSFAVPARYVSSGQTRCVATGDVNGDGTPDLLAANRKLTTISVLSNMGRGDFVASVDFEVGTNPELIATGDFDRDGNLDVASMNGASLDLSIVLNQGAGVFGAPTSHSIGSRPLSLSAGDFNGDGSPDLIALATGSLSLLLNGGDGVFPDPTRVSTSATDLSVSDFDGDGDLDAVLSNTASVSLKLNDGSGSFTVSRELPLDREPIVLAAGDFDGDGDRDLALTTVNPSSIWLLRNSDETLSVVGTTEIPVGACAGGGGCVPHSGNIADFDNDGDLDIVATPTFPATFTIMSNEGNGNWVRRPPHTFSSGNPQFTAVGDLDGDNNIDAVTADYNDGKVGVHLGKGDGTFGSSRQYRVGLSPLGVQLSDFDGDGSLDVACANAGDQSVSVLGNRGDGTLDPRTDYRLSSEPKALTALDIENDGDLDIAVATNRVSILTNSGDATFTDGTEYRLLESPHHIAAGDFDGDGWMDLATANISSKSCSLLLNNRDGTFAEPRDSVVGRSPFSLVPLDFDGDGVLDLATANQGDFTVSILLGNGDGTFSEAEHHAVGRGPRWVFAGDFDGDGDTDVATINRPGRSVGVLYNAHSDFNTADFLETICTPGDFQNLAARASGQGSIDRFIKYTLPASEESSLPTTVFQNTRRFPLHQGFLTQVFPNYFPLLPPQVYDNLVGRRASRQYFVGAIVRIRRGNNGSDSIDTDDMIATDGIASGGGPLYGFTIFADFSDPEESLRVDEVQAIFEKLRLAFQLEPFAYAPASRDAVEVAEQWQDPAFPIYLEAPISQESTYVPYTRGVAYGRVRLLTRAAFDDANRSGGLSFQDIPILDHAPTDIEGVVSAVITQEPQNPGSHLTVRMNRRGTPNAFLENAQEEFAPYADQLVRLETKSTTHSVQAATQQEAEEWWSVNRPSLSVLPSVDPDFSEFPSLLEIAAMDLAVQPTDGDLPSESRFGGKATNLARLQTILDGETSRYRERGFAIPVHYYLEFLRTNTIRSLLDADRQVTYEEYLRELFADEGFQSDSRRRFQILAILQDHMRNEGVVHPELIARLASRIEEVMGTPQSTRVRFRSSSNVEDAIEFNGAGLYDSTSACPLDDLDGDGRGPSHCDPSRQGERGITRALKRVWASLWNFRAYEERAFYGIPQELAAMAVLVNRTFIDESANGVAFTGNPTNPFDRRYLVVVQQGENSVVSSEPGVVPEQNLLEVEEGNVVGVLRAVASSLVPAGTFILSDAELEELGALMWHIDHRFPIDLGDHAREDVFLDLEFKKLQSGELAVKQVRPLLVASDVPAPTFELEIPPGTVACGVFRPGRGPRAEYELKSTLSFVAKTLPLATRTQTFSADLFEEVVFGPDRQRAIAVSEGAFSVERLAAGDGLTRYLFDFRQQFLLPGGEEIEVEVSNLDFEAREAEPVTRQLVLDDAFLTDEIFLHASVRRDEAFLDAYYSSCRYETLPLWEVHAEFADGSTLDLEESFRPELLRVFGPAALTRAELILGGRHDVQDVTDYWDLVYSASRHNQGAHYWVVLETPVVVPGVDQAVHAVELVAPAPIFGTQEHANYLGENFEVLAEIAILAFRKEEVSRQVPFQRGDVDASGAITTADAVSVLFYLFLSTPSVPCKKAADANDDGRLNLSDAVGIVLHLFKGRTVPDPSAACGVDRSVDALTCEFFAACE